MTNHRLPRLAPGSPNDRASTFHQFSVEPTPSGRFANQTSRMIIGEKPTIDYPAAATWTRDRLPNELPRGADVNQAPIVGEPREVEESLSVARDGKKCRRKS